MLCTREWRRCRRQTKGRDARRSLFTESGGQTLGRTARRDGVGRRGLSAGCPSLAPSGRYFSGMIPFVRSARFCQTICPVSTLIACMNMKY